jgi:hypothetical protein
MGRPDIDISTRVRAKELRFGTVPRVKVWFEGEPGHESSSQTERENLPDEVEPDVTYRDIEVRWRARSRIVHPTDPDQVSKAEEP